MAPDRILIVGPGTVGFGEVDPGTTMRMDPPSDVYIVFRDTPESTYTPEGNSYFSNATSSCSTGPFYSGLLSDMMEAFRAMQKMYQERDSWYVAGNLRHLYRSPVTFHLRRVCQYRIKQPCWKRGRWKSLT